MQKSFEIEHGRMWNEREMEEIGHDTRFLGDDCTRLYLTERSQGPLRVLHHVFMLLMSPPSQAGQYVTPIIPLTRPSPIFFFHLFPFLHPLHTILVPRFRGASANFFFSITLIGPLRLDFPFVISAAIQIPIRMWPPYREMIYGIITVRTSFSFKKQNTSKMNLR